VKEKKTALLIGLLERPCGLVIHIPVNSKTYFNLLILPHNKTGNYI